jgi:phytoene dehydrogenase-like protein
MLARWAAVSGESGGIASWRRRVTMSETGPAVGIPSDDHYDVIVIGAGLGGLSAAACGARIGKKVLLLERQDAYGGAAHAFRRGPYLFDPAIHFTGQTHPGEIIDIYLQALGVRDQVEFIELGEMSGSIFPGERFRLPVGMRNMSDALAARFPEDAEGLEAFTDLCLTVTQQSRSLTTRLSLDKLDDAVAQFPQLFRYRSSTFSEVLDQYLTNDRLKAVLGAGWPYQAVPPSELSFVDFVGLIVSCFDQGPVYCRGSFQSLADAFMTAIEAGRGDVRLNTTVTGITVDDGHVTGVVLEGGQRLEAGIVVSNIDARVTFEKLLGLEHLPDTYVRRLRRMKPSVSAFVLFAATTLDIAQFDVGEETLLFQHWDHDESYRDVLEGRLGGTWMAIPSLADPSLAPTGEHVIIFSALVPYDIGEPWETARVRLQGLALEELEKLFPGFGEHITFLEAATPETMEQFLGTVDGAVYGWANNRFQVQPKRLPRQTPVPGLFLAGGWTEPGPGSVRVIYSGFLAAMAMFGFEDVGSFLGALFEA